MLAQGVLYPKIYPVYVIGAMLDIVCTWIVLLLGGMELNGLAAAVIRHGGLGGMIAFKVSTMVVVLVICEFVGRRAPRAGMGLATIAAGISFVPVIFGTTQIAMAFQHFH